MLLGHTLQIFSRHSQNLFAIGLPIIFGPFCRLIVDKYPEHLRLALELPWEGFDCTLLGSFQLFLCHQRIANTLDLVEHNLCGQRHRRILTLKTGAEITRVVHPRRKRGTSGVCQPFVAAHLLHDAARKATRPKDVV